ncbi:DUF596 domain-containing protein [Providencia hangzhouensis]|uniref:DUF596 domain-containing protein n=1 Tax=Providencia hangzhouensis TaxID=3031799 RepID=UPI0034DCF7A2
MGVSHARYASFSLYANDNFPFQERKKIFFWFLDKLLRDGKLKLAKYGKFLSGSIDEQLQCFYTAFPETEEQLN